MKEIFGEENTKNLISISRSDPQILNQVFDGQSFAINNANPTTKYTISGLEDQALEIYRAKRNSDKTDLFVKRIKNESDFSTEIL